jgi:hypothetical protein
MAMFFLMLSAGGWIRCLTLPLVKSLYRRGTKSAKTDML